MTRMATACASAVRSCSRRISGSASSPAAIWLAVFSCDTLGISLPPPSPAVLVPPHRPVEAPRIRLDLPPDRRYHESLPDLPVQRPPGAAPGSRPQFPQTSGASHRAGVRVAEPRAIGAELDVGIDEGSP